MTKLIRAMTMAHLMAALTTSASASVIFANGAVPPSMESLQDLLKSSASSHAMIYNEGVVVPPEVTELREVQNDAVAKMKAIQAKADGEKRALTTDEDKAIAELSAVFDSAQEDIERRLKIANQAKILEDAGAQPLGRRTDPNNAAIGRFTQYRQSDNQLMRTGGFNSFGEFGRAVVAACRKGNPEVDPRLTAMNAAPDQLSREGVGSDGGFSVPPDFRSEIVSQVYGEDNLLGRTDQQTTTSNQMTWPVDKNAPWSTGGIQASWEGEGKQIAQSKIDLSDMTVRANKLTALVPVTNELMEDSASLSSYLRSKTPDAFNYKINEALIRGSGAGMPKGILNSGSLIQIAKESGQAAGTVLYQNIVNMWSRLYAPWRRNAVWLYNQDLEPALMNMSFPVSGGATAVPVYLPAGGLANAPYSTLFGKPMLPIENMSAVGEVGDLVFADLSRYLTLAKNGGLRQDMSIHLFFDYDVTAFRFIFRLGGQPWWDNQIERPNGLSRSAFVALEARG